MRKLQRPGLALLLMVMSTLVLAQSQKEEPEIRTNVKFKRSEVMIPMRDGVKLSTDIYRPATDGVGVNEKLPTILQRFKVTAVPMSEVSGKVISTMLCPTTAMMMRLDEQDGRFESHPVRGNIHDMVDLREVRRSIRKAA